MRVVLDSNVLVSALIIKLNAFCAHRSRRLKIATASASTTTI